MSILLRSLSLLVGITLAAPASSNCLSAKETKQGVLLTSLGHQQPSRTDGCGFHKVRDKDFRKSRTPISVSPGQR
ncbi:hypothetical protein ACCS52_31875, partial [Rhizobium ruizarguesonis]